MENMDLTAIIEGKKGRERPRGKYLNGLVKTTNGKVTTAVKLLRATRDRQEWKSLVVKAMEGMA